MSIIEPIAIAILAKAPIPGFAKTRLIPALGPEGAALLQARLIARTLATACAAATGELRAGCGLLRADDVNWLPSGLASHVLNASYTGFGAVAGLSRSRNARAAS